MRTAARASEEYKWPKKCFIKFYGKEAPYCTFYDRGLDLVETLIFPSTTTRTITMGMRSFSVESKTWNQKLLEEIEALIKYDFAMDGFSVSIKRIWGEGERCREEMLWKLVIRG